MRELATSVSIASFTGFNPSRQQIVRPLQRMQQVGAFVFPDFLHSAFKKFSLRSFKSAAQLLPPGSELDPDYPTILLIVVTMD